MDSRARSLRRKSKVRRTGDPIPWKYCLLTLVCGFFLVAGFFYAARQHFASVNTSMDNAKLRKQIEEIKSQERRLKLAREVASTPSEIKKAAKKLGLQTMTARNLEVVKTKDEIVKDVELKAKKTDTKKENSNEDPRLKEKFDKEKKKTLGKEIAKKKSRKSDIKSFKDNA